jgi:hypothetical protein
MVHASAVPTMPPPTMHTSTGSAPSVVVDDDDDAEKARAKGRRTPPLARIRRASHVIALEDMTRDSEAKLARRKK